MLIRLLPLAVFLMSVQGTKAAEGFKLMAQPGRIELQGADNEHGVLITRIDKGGERTDVTRLAHFASSAPEIVTVDAMGHCRAISDGEAEIAAEVDGQQIRLKVSSMESGKPRVPSFKQDIIPILTKTGCNAGGCHGKLAGQNGFRLSLRGFAPEWDHDWVSKEVNSRRINVAFPAESLIVQKAAGLIAHEGGTRFKQGSRYYQTLLDWVGARAPGPVSEEADAIKLEVLPGDRQMKPGQTQRLLVRALYADGRTRDVTWLAQFFSNDDTTVSVKPDGLVKAIRAGESSVRVHFQGQVDVIRFTMPFETVAASEQFKARQNTIDAPIFDKLEALHIPPSGPCDDQTFLRRASLDATGTLPAPEEVTAFLSDAQPDKRSRLVETLLSRPEFVDYWTLQLADLLQNRKERDHDVRGTKGVRAFHSWLREQVAANRPWNELARAILLTNGTVDQHPELGYFLTVVGEKQKVEESELPDSVAQSFLGTRIGCARCHNHPLEKYTQDDFYRFAAFFSKVALKRAEPGKGLSALSTISREEEEQLKKLDEATARFEEAQEAAASIGEEPGAEELIKKRTERAAAVAEAKKRLAEIQRKPPGVNQPRTGKMMAPMPLDRTALTIEPGRDPREPFVEWMLSTENFSGAMVNRLWKHFFKVGLVEPVDDLRASNPPSNGELWTLLNKEFASHGYDLKHVMRLILNSRAYQLSSDTLAGNEKESKFFSHYYARRLPAEVLTDGIAEASKMPTAFPGYPVGTRAIQLPDPGVSSYFLSLFGRSDRVTACACERAGEVTLPQLLHLHNSEDLLRQIQSGDGRLHALLKEGGDRKVIDSLLLATAGRHATEPEVAAVAKALASDDREAVFQDFFWALLNSKEFSFNH